MEIGKLGAFCLIDAMPAPESAAFGESSKWATKSPGRPRAGGCKPFVRGAYIVDNTDGLIYATGIANVWVRDRMTMAAAVRTLAELALDRFMVYSRHQREPLFASRRSAVTITASL
jgi:hypothetical protein